jgi:hypothetical protein
MFFVGDGYEVLAAEAWRANALAKRRELIATMGLDENAVHVYECDPNELEADSAGELVWAYPAERAAAEASGYELLTFDEAVRKY